MSEIFFIFKTHYLDNEFRHNFTFFTDSFLKKRFILLLKTYVYYVYLSACMHIHMPFPSEVEGYIRYPCSSITGALRHLL